MRQLTVFAPSVERLGSNANARLFASALAVLLMRQLLEALLAGFENEVYDGEEMPAIWYVGEQVAKTALGETAILLRAKDPSSRAYLELQRRTLRNLESICRHHFQVSEALQSFSSFYADAPHDSLQHGQACFQLSGARHFPSRAMQCC